MAASTIRLGTAMILGALAIVLVLGSFLLIQNGQSPSNFVNLQPVEHFRSIECWDKTINLVRPQGISVDVLTAVDNLCYQEKQHEYQLENRHIQRYAFIEQHYIGRVMLWMVVAITISGILLAALQLYAGFKLALKSGTSLAQDGSLDLEAGKISLKSSVTGLLILGVSFAFFLVFVDKIYTIREVTAPTVGTDGREVQVGIGVPVPVAPVDAGAAAPVDLPKKK